MKRCIICLIVIWFMSLILSGLSFAEILISPNGKAPFVILFKSQKHFDYFVKECKGRPLDDDCWSCYAGTPPVNTKIMVIEGSWSFKKVRVMDGNNKGLVGWVPSEMIK